MKNETLLITGAATGFGKALCFRLAKQGGNLILLDKDKRALQALYDELDPIENCFPVLYPMNLAGAQIEDYQSLSEVIKKEFGELHSIIHNAAQFDGLSPLSHTKVFNWFETIQTNLSAPYLLSQACLELLVENNKGNIVYITDDFSNSTPAYRGAYAVSKAGLDTLMKITAEEIEETSNIKVFSFNPGFMETAFLAKIYPGHEPGTLVSTETIADECVNLMLEKTKQEIHGKVIKSELACFEMNPA